MDNCNDFEVAIEMRIHGALPRDEEAALAVHLGTCANCRAFEDIAKKTENVMSQQALSQMQTMDWEALFAKTRTFIDRSVRERITTAVPTIVATASMVALMVPQPERVVGEIVFAGAVALVAVWLVSRRTIARAARDKNDVGELLFLYRCELEKRLRATTLIYVVLPLIALEYSVFRPFLVSTQAWVGFGGFVAALLGAMAHVVLVRRPRIQRELDALKADVKK